jgi:hypothetical protein
VSMGWNVVPDWTVVVILNPVNKPVLIGFLKPVTNIEISVFGEMSDVTLPEIVSVSTWKLQTSLEDSTF